MYEYQYQNDPYISEHHGARHAVLLDQDWHIMLSPLDFFPQTKTDHEHLPWGTYTRFSCALLDKYVCLPCSSFVCSVIIRPGLERLDEIVCPRVYKRAIFYCCAGCVCAACCLLQEKLRKTKNSLQRKHSPSFLSFLLCCCCGGLT